ncbi:MAG TPA: nuclear transport factor 2 family protein [Longimicrobiales bacterium]|nr:nuclear transport factor 2 family protein [Longimicrobiales bacterium]
MPIVSRPLERGSGVLPEPRFFVLLLAIAVGTAACTVEPRPIDDGGSEAPTSTLAGVEAMLDASAASWNAGDLDGFLDDYTGDPDLAFVGASGVTRGIAEVRARYETGYWSTGAPRDSLRFEDIEVRPLGDRHALALGRYVLYRPAGSGTPEDTVTDPNAAGRGDGAADGETVTSTGWFSLVLGLDDGRWRILHDHTSELTTN